MDASRLRSVPLFSELGDDDLGKCAELFNETELLAGTHLAKEGDFAYKFFVVLDGQVEVQRHFEKVAELGEGEFFGEMALLTGQKRNARVVALSAVKLAWVMPWDFERMTDEFPQVAAKLASTVEERMSSIPPRAE